MKILFNKNQGNALIMTIIVTFMFFIFAGSLLTMSMFSNNANTNVYEREQARIVARSTVLSLKEYMQNEGDKSFSTVGVPASGGASNISASSVFINTDTGSLGEADNIRVNVIDKSSSEWEVTLWATGYYPSIDYGTSGVDASVTFNMPKSSNNSDGVLSDFNDNVLNSLNGDVNIFSDNIVVGGVYAGGNINMSGTVYFLKSPQIDDNYNSTYIRAGGNIDYTQGKFRFDVDGIEAGGSISIPANALESWSQDVTQLEQIGITAPSTVSFHNTVLKTPVEFKTEWTASHFEGSNSILMHTPETRINIMPIDIDLELREVPTVNDLNLFQPIEILMNDLPKGENVPKFNLDPNWSNASQDKYIDHDVRLTGKLHNDGSNLTIDASQNDIVIYIDEKITISHGSNIIIDDGRDHTGENSNSVVFIIGDGGELVFEGSGIRLNSESNIEVPQVYFISDSYNNVLTISHAATVKGFVIAPNSTVTLSAGYTKDTIPNFHGSIIANDIKFTGTQLTILEKPIESTMDRVTSRYISEVRGGSND